MAFRDDEGALHARIESLEKELDDARTELNRLAEIERERDRLKARLALLEPKPKKERERDAARATQHEYDVASAEERALASSLRMGATRNRQRLLLAALGALLVLGLVVWYVAAGSGGTSGPKPTDTRAPSIGVVDLSAAPDPVPIAFTVTGTDDAPSGCAGHLPSAPQLALRTSSPMVVRITTESSVDLVAVLSGAPAGLLCDDDGGDGQNPLIQTVLRAGEARLTIGTYSSGREASGTIVLHAIPLPESVEPSGLAPSAIPRHGIIALSQPREQTSLSSIVEAALVPAAPLQSGCVGNLNPTPDFVLSTAYRKCSGRSAPRRPTSKARGGSGPVARDRRATQLGGMPRRRSA